MCLCCLQTVSSRSRLLVFKSHSFPSFDSAQFNQLSSETQVQITHKIRTITIHVKMQRVSTIKWETLFLCCTFSWRGCKASETFRKPCHLNTTSNCGTSFIVSICLIPKISVSFSQGRRRKKRIKEDRGRQQETDTEKRARKASAESARKMASGEGDV